MKLTILAIISAAIALIVLAIGLGLLRGRPTTAWFGMTFLVFAGAVSAFAFTPAARRLDDNASEDRP